MVKISVIMCTYNGVAYLGEQLDSLRTQTLPPHELVVQDDGSTDGTMDLLRDYQQRHPGLRIRLFANPERLGYNRNFLTAVQRAEGDLIACCDQDDVWHADKLEVLARELGDAPLVFHNSTLMTNDRRELGLLHTRPLPPVIPSLGAMLYPRAYGHQIMFRRELLPALARFIPDGISYDYLIYTVAAAAGPLRYVHQSLVQWRRHTEATTFNPSPRKSGKWDGYLRTVEALRQPDNRERTRRYFAVLAERMAFSSPLLAKAVNGMARGNLGALLSVCRLCLHHDREAVPDVQEKTTRRLRAFFLPLFFVRDHGRYIIPLQPHSL